MSKTGEPTCDQYLSATQVRNPKLPRSKNGDSIIDSAPWPFWEAFGCSALLGAGFGAVGVVGVGVTELLTDPSQSVWVGVPAMLVLVVYMLGMFFSYIAPSIWKPLEFGTLARKDAWLKYNALSLEHRIEIGNAFNHFMETPSKRAVLYGKAEKLWNDSYNALKKREELLKPEELAHPRLEEAHRDLQKLQDDIRELENGK